MTPAPNFLGACGHKAGRQATALRLTLGPYGLSLYISAQSVAVLPFNIHPNHNPSGMGVDGHDPLQWRSPPAGKTCTGQALGNLVLQTEGRVTFIDSLLATL